jgi:hypothetical protein
MMESRDGDVQVTSVSVGEPSESQKLKWSEANSNRTDNDGDNTSGGEAAKKQEAVPKVV